MDTCIRRFDSQPILSRVDFDLVVLELDHRGATQNFEEDGHTFAGNTLDEALHAAQGRVFEAHGLSRLEVAEFLQGGVVAVLLELANALHELIVEHGGLKAKAHDGGDAFGAAHRRDALFRLAGPKQNVAREHGLKERNRALLGFLEFFVQRQIGFEVLLLQVHLGDFFFTGFGVGEVPALGWRDFREKLV